MRAFTMTVWLYLIAKSSLAILRVTKLVENEANKYILRQEKCSSHKRPFLEAQIMIL